MDLEQQAWEWLDNRRRLQWHRLNPSDSIRDNDDPSWADPSLLEMPLRSAVKRLIELSPPDWPERQLLVLL